MQHVFDRGQIARQRSRFRSSETGDRYFLFDWTMREITDRLSIVRRDFPVCLTIGGRGKAAAFADHATQTYITLDASASVLPPQNGIVAEEDFLPVAKQSIDLAVSVLSLHTVNDLPGALLQIRESLKPDGLFLAGMFGGETLRELRECLYEAEIELRGRVSPRVAPFADKPQMGTLMQRAGFALPVVDSEILTVTYDNIFALMHDLRTMGEANAVRERTKYFTPRSVFLRAGELYAARHADPDGRIRASFEIIFLLGWAPHETQQKPLRPGSAQTRLADFLGTEEIGTGEKPH
ncbi:MAG: SAM-dependent methyltransferase [Micavibrio aeruginosavorus]|uniref:SAM-dependent methyltransferase n=1 Tax=Micavibrio aeruginosavorus TaxID=349221 RepID=A0A2W5BW63_9BACT|nr:MAG: SAM-dependent methyltransferase [Micavibrio aeruginosavorus]